MDKKFIIRFIAFLLAIFLVVFTMLSLGQMSQKRIATSPTSAPPTAPAKPGDAGPNSTSFKKVAPKSEVSPKPENPPKPSSEHFTNELNFMYTGIADQLSLQ